MIPDWIAAMFGYPALPKSEREMNRVSRAVARAVAEAMYPGGAGREGAGSGERAGWPSFEDARVMSEVNDYLGKVVKQKRTLIDCLFLFTELSGLLRPPFRRFTRLSPERRRAMLNHWDEGRSSFHNLCSSSMRMLFNLAYLSDAGVKKRIGETARDDCRKEVEPRALTRKPDGTFDGILEFPALTGRTIKEEADFVIVGSGPGGAVAARELAEAGKRVIVLEEGAFYRPEEHAPSAIRVLRDVYREQGLRYTQGATPVRTFQARALGGTSLVNSAICWRAPEMVFQKWRDQHGVEGISREILDPHYDRAERNASVGPTEEAIWGGKGRLFMKGCQGVGVEGRPNRRAVKGCRGCSHCGYGCSVGAKQGMDRSYIPQAIAGGARFYTSCRVEELIVEGGRVAGVRGYVMEPGSERRSGVIEVRAKATILAAGAFATPLILMKNDLPYRSPAIGRNLCFHNGIAVAGVFDQDVFPWEGATQGCDTEQYIKDGIHMEVLWVSSAMLTARTRGFGDTLFGVLDDLRRTAFWCVAVRGSSRGRVMAGRGWEPRIYFDLNDADVRMLKQGMDLLVKHFFAAGAVKVRPGLGGFAPEIRTPAEVEQLRNTPVHARQLLAGGQHVYGTSSMGADPRASVVGSDCAVHGVPDLYVCDTGIYPSQSAVNPQLTLMALSSRLAEILAKRY